MKCQMVEQGFPMGSCLTKMPNGTLKRACEATLERKGDIWHRLIKSIHLSRPEDYLSIYQSGCSHNCLKCHSWHFSKVFNGQFYSTDEIAKRVAEYEEMVTVEEPRERALMYYATDLCRHCGSCIIKGEEGPLCPKKLSSSQIVLSPQGYGPARNIVAFTGGDVTCYTDFYVQVTEKIKAQCKNIWVLIEANGYGLTSNNLDKFRAAGVDSYWLDIKAYDEKIYRKLCGTTNEWILKAPQEIIDRGFVLEVLTLFIPKWVVTDQITKIAELIADIDPSIPFSVLAFFPEYKLQNIPSPTLTQMLKTYFAVKDVGLKNIRLGNIGVFAKTQKDWNILLTLAGEEAI
ncbi:MAG: radical SAM protein [Promethearchaeota archaeon]